MRYFANFEGDEIDGRVYALGEEIETKDTGTLAFLVSIGRVTERPDDDDAEGSSLGASGVNTGLADARNVGEMRRPELLSEARRHFEAHIGTVDDDGLRDMVDTVRRSQNAAPIDLTDVSPPVRDAMTANASTAPARDSFVPASIVAGTVEDTIPQLASLTPEQRAQVREAEGNRPRGARQGVIDALDALDAPAK